MTKQCATCVAWLAKDRATAYQAPCARGYGQVAWDGGCGEHEEEQPPAPNQQSQVRGVWGPYWPGVK